MGYTSLSVKDIKEMLAKVGVDSPGDLFSSIPDEIKLKRRLRIPEAMSEAELLEYFDEMAQRNDFENNLSFLGAGAYSHIIPTVVDYLSSRGEFVSPYTPYQPEVSQGTLQIIFEFQSLICQLTGMDIANASLYDGASGAAEAVLMAQRLTRKSKVLVAKTLHPQYLQVICTYIRNLDIELELIDFDDTGRIDMDDLRHRIDDATASVVVQSPNFYGVIEDLQVISDLAHENKALSTVVVSEAVSLGILKPPGEQDADIVTGEAQSLGMPLSFGGPFLGFMACGQKFIRQFPGRIAGQTEDGDGNRGFVLTLSTREQHIRRERATSNICTNQALCMLRAAIFMEALGENGLSELARRNVDKAQYALERLTQLPGVRMKLSGPVFNEFVLEFDRSWQELDASLRDRGIIGGLAVSGFASGDDHCALFCVTEKHHREEIDLLVSALDETLKS